MRLARRRKRQRHAKCSRPQVRSARPAAGRRTPASSVAPVFQPNTGAGWVGPLQRRSSRRELRRGLLGFRSAGSRRYSRPETLKPTNCGAHDLHGGGHPRSSARTTRHPARRGRRARPPPRSRARARPRRGESAARRRCRRGRSTVWFRRGSRSPLVAERSRVDDERRPLPRGGQSSRAATSCSGKSVRSRDASACARSGVRAATRSEAQPALRRAPSPRPAPRPRRRARAPGRRVPPPAR